MRAKKTSYRNARYDFLRRFNCCTVCKNQDERTRNGGALCARCLSEKRRKAEERKEQT
jgi:hypothetical protein